MLPDGVPSYWQASFAVEDTDAVVADPQGAAFGVIATGGGRADGPVGYSASGCSPGMPPTHPLWSPRRPG